MDDYTSTAPVPCDPAASLLAADLLSYHTAHHIQPNREWGVDSRYGVMLYHVPVTQ